MSDLERFVIESQLMMAATPATPGVVHQVWVDGEKTVSHRYLSFAQEDKTSLEAQGHMVEIRTVAEGPS